MKRVVICFLIVLFIYCGQNQVPQSDSAMVVFGGKISNPVEEKVNVAGNSGEVDENGNFSVSFKIEKAGYFRFRHGERTSIYLSPGDSIYLTLDTKEFDETLKYTGKGAEVNNYLASKYLIDERNKPDWTELNSLPVNEFVSVIDPLKEKLMNHLNGFSGLSKEFIEREKMGLLYDWAVYRTAYPTNFEELTGERFTDDNGDYQQYLSKLNLNDSSLLSLGQYREFLNLYIDWRAIQLLTKNNQATERGSIRSKAKYKIAMETFTVPAVRDRVLYSIMFNQIVNRGVDNIDELISIFIKDCGNDKFKNKIQDKYEKRKVLAKGNPAPEFKLVDIKGDSIALSDFKGKYVLIDIWSTSCNPCLREIPHLQTIEKEFEGKNIVFIAISLDKNKEKWENYVKEHNMHGFQLFTGGWNSSIIKNYYVYSVPRFILLDKEGKFIKAFAPRPSWNLRELLQKLL